LKKTNGSLTKLLSLVLTLVMLIPIFSTLELTSYAATYDPNAALNYAAAHCNDTPQYSADCANFVSKCLTAGGINVNKTGTRGLYNAVKGYGTVYKLTLTSGKIKASSNTGKVSPGDPIFYYCNNCEVYPHVVLCGGTDKNGYITVYGHTSPQNNSQAQTWVHKHPTMTKEEYFKAIEPDKREYCFENNMSVYCVHINTAIPVDNNIISWNKLSASNITSTSAVVRADVTAKTGYIKTIGLQMWKDGESAKSVASWPVGNVLTYCSVACDGTEAPKLSAGTKYNYRFYIVKTDGSNVYSDTKFFTTSGTVASAIRWDKLSISNMTANSAVIRADVTATTSLIKTIGLQMWKDGESAKSVASWSVGNVLTFCSVACDGTEAPKLSASTKYNYRFYIVRTDGTYEYSTSENFTTSSSTANIITWKKVYVENITETSAEVKTDVTATTSVINTIGLQLWKEGESVKSVASWPVKQILDYCYVKCDGSEAAKLSPGTKYYYRFFIIKTDGTYIYSETSTFTTPCSHTYNSGFVTKSATCTELGVKTFTCTKCGATKTESIGVLGHSYTATVIASTCTEQGYTIHQCSRCTAGYKDNYTALKSHDFDLGEILIEPTYEEAGTKIYCCKNCDTIKTESIPKLVPGNYTVTFNPNGGNCSTSSKTVTYNSTYSTLPTPTRTGYTFDGWYTSALGGSKVTSSTKYTTAGNTTLYAHWTANTYTVSYNANGGSGAPANQTKSYGTTLTLSSTKPTKAGYTFKNWNTKADGTGTTYSAGAAYTSNAAVTLYAQWTANAAHTHSYTEKITKNPTCTESGTKTFTCSCGTSYTETVSATGHSYGAWTVTKNATVSEEGTETRTCLKCLHKETRSIPKRNPFVKEETIAVNYKQVLTFDGNQPKQLVSSNSSVALVEGNNRIRVAGTGSATATATYEDGSQYIIHINAKYAWWQWIIIILLFGWIWY